MIKSSHNAAGMTSPRMFYRAPGKNRIDGEWVDYCVVDMNETTEDDVLAEGWYLSIPEAVSALPGATAPSGGPSDDAPPTREELLQKAKELGLVFKSNVSSTKLAAMIEAALAEGF